MSCLGLAHVLSASSVLSQQEVLGGKLDAAIFLLVVLLLVELSPETIWVPSLIFIWLLGAWTLSNGLNWSSVGDTN